MNKPGSIWIKLSAKILRIDQFWMPLLSPNPALLLQTLPHLDLSLGPKSSTPPA
jgi:hypothetical protein